MKDHLDKVTFLTQDDLNYMYEQAFLFQEWKRGIYSMIDISEGLSTPYFDEHNYHVSMELKKEAKYTKRKLLRELEEKAEYIARSFVHAIQWYLEKKYEMDIEVICTEEMIKRSEWKEQDYIQEIIDQLRVQFGENSRVHIQLQQLSDKILKKEPIQNGRVLEFPNQHKYAWLLIGSTVRTDFIEEILSVACYQEKDTFTIPEHLKILLSMNYEESQIPVLSSVEKYKVYKNGKLSITFSSKEAVSSFVTLLEENRTV